MYKIKLLLKFITFLKLLYMHYKFINTQRKQFETADDPVDEQFHIEPEEALELLKAGIYLQC